MMKLIYGSTAIKHWFPDYIKEPKDLDIISNEDITKSADIKTEVYWTSAFEYLVNNTDANYVDPDLLYTIKVSHLAWDINWEKHVRDMHFLQLKGCKLNKEFYNLLVADWKIIHGKKQFSFDKKHEELFKDNVNRKYNHDDLHEIFKFNDTPLYKTILVNPDKALCSEDKFNKLSDELKLQLMLEEIAVVAYERYVIPRRIPVKHALNRALKDLITRMTKGWFNLHLIQNSSKLIFINEQYLNLIKEKGSKIC